ncbi:unnamed protein product, partial [Laminaria digitata]
CRRRLRLEERRRQSLRILQGGGEGQRRPHRPVQDSLALCVLQSFQETLHRRGREDPRRAARQVWREGQGRTREERSQAQGCVGRPPRHATRNRSSCLRSLFLWPSCFGLCLGG